MVLAVLGALIVLALTATHTLCPAANCLNGSLTSAGRFGRSQPPPPPPYIFNTCKAFKNRQKPKNSKVSEGDKSPCRYIAGIAYAILHTHYRYHATFRRGGPVCPPTMPGLRKFIICTTHRGFDSAQPPGPLPERSRRQHLRPIYIWRTSHRRDAMHCVPTMLGLRQIPIHHPPKDRNP